jgi:hypothetical protein
VSYRAVLAGASLAQFDDLKDDQAAYRALMDSLAVLVDAPWDAWPVRPGNHLDKADAFPRQPGYPRRRPGRL